MQTQLITDHSGSKYLRTAYDPVDGKSIRVDVYSVLAAFKVTCPARAHAIKKLLCAGLRNKGSEAQDVRESIDALQRAVQMQEIREQAVTSEITPDRDET